MRAMTRIALIAALAIAFAAPASAQNLSNYYRGKTVRVIVGTSAGGGFDLYSRAIAQALPRHLPGNPLVIVQNMAGAGSLTAANYIANAAPKDGTVIGAPNPNIVTDALFYPDRVKFDARKVKWIGSALKETHVATAWYKTNVKSFDDVFAHEFVVAGGGGTSTVYPLVLNAVLGTKFKLVAGYPGLAEGNLAMARGEVDGVAGITWASVKATQAEALRDNHLRILLQFGLTRHQELPNVPWVFDYAKSEADKVALKLVLSPQEFGRPYMVADGVPDGVVALLRTAFDETMKDEAFRADAAKRHLDLDPATGVDIQTVVEDIYRTPALVVARVHQILEAAAK
jgi:tripartite-type tricarboxylate transporter receptor subunit TctC